MSLNTAAEPQMFTGPLICDISIHTLIHRRRNRHEFDIDQRNTERTPTSEKICSQKNMQICKLQCFDILVSVD